MSFDATLFRDNVKALLESYAKALNIPDERHVLQQRQIANGGVIHTRRTFPGHVTTSAFILDGAGERILLIHHRSLDRWLQPGGHYEAPDDLAAAGLREAVEETGMEGLVIDPW